MGTLSPPSNCDHSVVFAEMNIRTFKCHSYKREIWNFNNADFPALNRELLQSNWSSLFDSAFDIDAVYNTWFAHFRTIIEKRIPLKIVTIRPKDKPWMNGEVRYRSVTADFEFIIIDQMNTHGKIIVDNVT